MSQSVQRAAWSLAGIAFAVGSVWIHYEVKVKMRGLGHGTSDRLGRIEVGSEAPDFSASDLESRPVVLSDFRGHSSVIVDFWATWCAPCLRSMPALQEIADELGESGLEVIGVNLGEDPEHVRRFVERSNYTFRIVADTDSAIGDRFGVTAIPAQIVVGKDGIVKWVQVGYSHGREGELRQLLEQLTQ